MMNDSVLTQRPQDVRTHLKRIMPIVEAATFDHPSPPDCKAPDAAVDSVALFSMGWPPEAVGQALVTSRGDATTALALLRAGKVAEPPPSGASPELPDAPEEDREEEAEEARQLERALKMSLESEAAPSPAKRAKPAAERAQPSAALTSSANPLWAPPRYTPAADGLEGGSTLNLVEQVMVRDGGYAWQAATAFLDTGNQHMTLVDPAFAAKNAIYCPDEPPSWSNHAGVGYGQAERWTTIRGVVAGATARAPVVTIALKVRAEEMVLQVAVSELHGHDLLLGSDALSRLFAAGYGIGAGSM